MNQNDLRALCEIIGQEGVFFLLYRTQSSAFLLQLKEFASSNSQILTVMEEKWFTDSTRDQTRKLKGMFIFLDLIFPGLRDVVFAGLQFGFIETFCASLRSAAVEVRFHNIVLIRYRRGDDPLLLLQKRWMAQTLKIFRLSAKWRKRRMVSFMNRKSLICRSFMELCASHLRDSSL